MSGDSGPGSGRRQGVDPEAGLLLVEVLVALVIASLAVMAIGRLLLRLEADAAFVSHQATARRIAENRLETLRLAARRPATRPLVSGQRTLGPPGSGSDEERPGLERRYRCRWRVARRGPVLADLEVGVDWDEGRPPDGHRSLTLRTLVDTLPIHHPIGRAGPGP